MLESANIARHLGQRAALQPTTPALKVPQGRNREGRINYLTLSFAELDAEVDAWVAYLRQYGVEPGDRVVVMVRQGLPLIAAAFALFKSGAVPVVIDPGMGLKNFLCCVERSRPRILLGIPTARLISRIFRRAFSTVERRVPASGNALARRTSQAVHSSPKHRTSRTDPIFRDSSDLAAIVFTSGSTGSPKGVCYEHGMFEAQVRLIQAAYEIQPGEIDLPLLPIFALFNPALGMTTVVPEIDPRHPAAMNPSKIVQAIQQEGVTNSFGSPTLWNKIGQYCIQHKTTLPSLKRVLCAGAPVPASLWERSAQFLPHGELHSPYGATEALPVSSISAAEIFRIRAKHESRGAERPALVRVAGAANMADQSGIFRKTFSPGGTCVGRPVPGVSVKIIALHEGPIVSFDDVLELPHGEVGEIIVAGPVVTKNYDAQPAATAAAKIKIPNGDFPRSGEVSATSDSLGTCHIDVGPSSTATAALWHRMGDCGYFDADGLLWFCGRKVERVETRDGVLFTEPCEQVFRSEAGVALCALIGLGRRPAQTPAIVIELECRSLSSSQKNAFAARLLTLAKADSATRMISHFYFHPKFPVDVRHNAKIHRLTLAKWAATQKPTEIP